jgi:hypothetical protein
MFIACNNRRKPLNVSRIPEQEHGKWEHFSALTPRGTDGDNVH